MRFDIEVTRLWRYTELEGGACRPFSFVEIYIDFSLPFCVGFYPDIQHITWVKRAWGLLKPTEPKPPYKAVFMYDDTDVDPIPF